MSTFDEYGPWISVVSSFLVLLVSALLLLVVMRRSSAGKSDSLTSDVDPLLGRVATVRKKLAVMGSARGSSDPTMSIFAGESLALAQRIRTFNEALAEWCGIAKKHRGTSEFNGSMSELERLKDKVVGNPDFTPDGRKEYFNLTGELATKVVSSTDRDLSKVLDTTGKLDGCVRRLCAAAGVELIEPRAGEAFDMQRHRNMGEAAESARRGPSQGKPKVNKIISRGVELTRERGGKVMLPAEIEVRY